MAAGGKGGGPRRGSPKGLAKKSAAGGKDGRRAPSGSGGYGRKRLEGKGPTPKAADRTKHPAARRAVAASRRAEAGPGDRRTGPHAATGNERTSRAGSSRAGTSGVTVHVAGRISVVEALRAQVPATALLVAAGLERDPRVTEAVKLAAAQGIPLIESAKPELDRLTSRALHQGLVLRVPPYSYAHPDDLLARALDDTEPALLVALDGVTDPRNLGAVVRSAAAFGSHGVVVPVRRSAGMTSSAWKASAGAAARLPVAQATNLTRTLKGWAASGVLVAGLAADGALSLDDLELARGPLVLVIGSEGAGLSRLVAEACDVTVSIPLAAAVESLNAGVAAGVALAEVSRRRRLHDRL